MPQVVIGRVEEFADGRGTAITVAGRRVAVFRSGAEVWVVDNQCAHRGFPLHDGLLRGATVQCRTHGACFDLATGAALRGPTTRAIRVYPVIVVDDQVLVDWPE